MYKLLKKDGRAKRAEVTIKVMIKTLVPTAVFNS